MENKLRSVDGLSLARLNNLLMLTRKLKGILFKGKQEDNGDNVADKQSRQPVENDELTVTADGTATASSTAASRPCDPTAAVAG